MTGSKATAYEVITDQVIALIENAGQLPWERPWNITGTDAPMSVRKRPYRGVNRLMLGMAGSLYGYRDNRWITFKQAKEMGGSVRKGEKSLPVILWKPVSKETTNDQGETVEDSYLVARYYRVFNVNQCDGLDLESLPEPERHEWDPLETAELVVATMPDPPSIGNGGGIACYTPARDHVTMPDRESFPDRARYYGTLIHELAHATGHERRLNRKLSEAPAPFGSADYSREELTAELASAFVCGAIGIATASTTRDHAAYLASWLAALRADPKALPMAAARASKAADWILAGMEGED